MIKNKIINYVATMQDISDRKKLKKGSGIKPKLRTESAERTSELSITNEFLMREMVNRKRMRLN